MSSPAVEYNPNGVGVDNGNFLGLPPSPTPRVQFVAVPFGVTVSYGTGTEDGPANVLAASRQLDVSLVGVDRPWELGFSWRTASVGEESGLAQARNAVESVIARLERGLPAVDADIALVNAASEHMLHGVEAAVAAALRAGSLPVLIGGEHAVSLGAFRACAKTGPFGILQVDAHMDLRVGYEGFRYSHASVMHNALGELNELTQLTQVGIRDFCPEEFERIDSEAGRLATFFDDDLKTRQLHGTPWAALVDEIVATLPDRVWISFDIDGLDPALCAHTGTPVAGGLSFAEALFLCRAAIASGRKVVGIDIVEVAPEPYEFEGAVAARIAYDLACRAASH